jgi:hypothetical protein
MRTARKGGLCADCGKASSDGLFWTNRLAVLDFGVPGLPAKEPDTTQPDRCDACEYLHRLRRDFTADPEAARRIYGPDLRLIGEG